MATVKIWRDEEEDDFLPRVCMACGDPAATDVRKGFSWHPPWVIVTILGGLIVYVIIALILTKRMTVRAPMCENHSGYFKNRALLLWLTFAVVAVLGIGVFVLMMQMEQQANQDLGGFACLAVVGLGVVWLILAAIVQFLSIRPVEITSDSISLVNVSQGFKDSLRDARDYEDAQREERRRNRPPRPRSDRRGDTGYQDRNY